MLLFIICAIVFLFAFVILRGAPYMPTHISQVHSALLLSRATPGQVAVDLGSGDGVFVKAAARHGLEVHGYELNPLLVLVSRLRCWSVRSQAHIYLADLWNVRLPPTTDIVFVFLHGRFMRRLDKKLQAESNRLGRSFVLVSYGFTMPHKKPIRQERALSLYHYQPHP